jgi:hypothetical protein
LAQIHDEKDSSGVDVGGGQRVFQLGLMWILFLLLAIAFAVWYVIDEFRMRTNEPSVIAQSSPVLEGEFVNVEDEDLELPKEWDERLLERKIKSLADSNNVAVLDYVLRSLKSRIVMDQDTRTAYKSTQFLSSLIERLGVVRQLRTAYDDLKLYEKELQIRVTKLDIEQLNQDIELQDLAHKKETQKKINKLEHQLKELDIQLEIAKRKREIDAVKNPPPPPPAPPPPPREPTREETQQQMRAASEERLSKLQRDKLADLARRRARGESEEELRRAENMWDDAIAAEEEELRKWL